jgi:DNA (cytosine-5)-methyltransferase 1
MKALDLFAGTGWGVACKQLGIDEVGVEIMPAAVETRAANGMNTIYNDVWDGLTPDMKLDYDILIASPPCQTFSLAGDGAGRAALDDVLAATKSGAYKDVMQLKQLGDATDMKTALVLTPLAHVYRDKPQYVVFEQVPPVLPVWEACAEEMRMLGYSVWTGNLNAEQYGVPQTRKRAVLIARLDGKEALPPKPTHSKYHISSPTTTDVGTAPWVSMKEALGWGFINRPCVTVGNSVGRGIGGGSGAQGGIARAFAAGTFMPSPRAKDDSFSEVTRMNFTDAGLIQSYPADFEWRGTKTAIYLQIGNAVPPRLAKAVLESVLA